MDIKLKCIDKCFKIKMLNEEQREKGIIEV